MRRLLAAALVAAAPAAAEDLSFSTVQTADCLAATASAGTQASCIGRSADACMAAEGGYSTAGMGGCLSREADFWDARLNQVYDGLMRAEQAFDAENAAAGLAVAKAADALQGMQRAWIAFRDAACAYQASQWGGGTGASPATAECLMRTTAEQSLRLETRLRAMPKQ